MSISKVLFMNEIRRDRKYVIYVILRELHISSCYWKLIKTHLIGLNIIKLNSTKFILNRSFINPVGFISSLLAH